MGSCTEMLRERDGGLQKPGFFKVLMPGFEKKLRIPPAFVKYITNLRDKRATLISPLGKLWSVNIHGCKEKMCFREGWPEFAQAHDLKLGCFMVFRYEDDRTFSFQVFDTSACRKDYSPVGVQSVARMDIRQDLNSEDASEDTSQGPMTQGSRKQIRMMDEGRPLTERTFSSCSGRKSFVAIISDYNLNRNYMSIPASFKESSDIMTKDEVILKDGEGRSWHVSICKRGKKGAFLAKGWRDFCVGNRLGEGDKCIFELASNEKDNIMLVRILKDSCNRLNEEKSFEVIVKDFNLTKPYMSIPASFRASNDIATKHQVILKDVEGRSWHVRVCNKGKRGVHLAEGWQEFCADHRLERGDKCIFELVSMEDNTLLVQIFKQMTQSCSRGMNQEEHSFSDHLDATRIHFLKTMDSDFSQQMELPVTSRRRLVTEKVASYLVNDPQHKACELYQFGRANMEYSLKIFPETFPLEGYDFCSSKRLQDDKQPVPHLLATRKSLQVNVKIADNTLSIKSAHSKIRNKGEKLSSNSVCAKEQTIRCKKVMNHCIEQELQLTSAMRLVTKEKKAQAWQKADAIQPTNPFFKKAMLRDAVSDRFRMYIPKHFAAKHLGHEQQTIVCSLPNGKETWNVNYKVYDEFSQFCGQWQKFAQDNGLEEGDVCIFELTRAHKDLAMDVHIFRVLDKNTPLHRGRRRLPMKREGSFLRIDG
ncbi:putative B3 domain-containing protein REM15 isoform X2 [Phoenix dactylifera]|uniref:B3 domain-containing protein REM15 isoform X2 n=2 Tax=Phoenix dactylifera TaxID=42345 RepID=A0A8B8ZVM3_PHODC|nr:putative B3 domain-containing protein REM15 isoform X2 [Phoenix dactylifera]